VTGIGVPHTKYTTIEIDGCRLQYSPENPNCYVLFC